MNRHVNKNRIFKEALFHILVIGFCFVMIYPLLWMLSSSFKEATEIFQSTSFLPT